MTCGAADLQRRFPNSIVRPGNLLLRRVKAVNAMLRNKKMGWTAEDDELLRRLAAQNMSRLLIAAKMKRSLDAIKRRATLLKITVARRPATGLAQAGETPPHVGGGA